MSEPKDDFQKLLKDMEIESENTLRFVVESVSVFWSPNPGLFHHGGLRVILSGAVEPKDSTSPTVAKHPTGTIDLHPLCDSGYAVNDQGEAIVGVLSALGDQIDAHLLLPAEDLRALATLLPTAAKERPPVQVWMHAFGGLKDWDGKEPLKLARTSIRIG